MEYIHCAGLGIQTLTDYSMSSRKPKPKTKENQTVLTEESLKGTSSALLMAVEGTEGGGRAAEDNRLPDLIQNRPPEPVPEDRREGDGEDGDDERENEDDQDDNGHEDADGNKSGKSSGKPKSKADKKKDVYGKKYKDSGRSNRMQKRQEKEEEEKEKQAKEDKQREREKRKERKHKLEELARKQEERKQKRKVDAQERSILQTLARQQKEEQRKRAKETPAQTKYRNMVMAERTQKERNKKTKESHELMQKWLKSHDLGKEARRVAREQEEKARKIEQERQRQARSRKSLVKVLQTPVEEDTSKPASSRTKPIAPGRVEDIPDPDFRGLEPQNRADDDEHQPGTSGLQAKVTLTRTDDVDDDDDDDYNVDDDDGVEIDDVKEELELSNVESDIDEEESQASMKVGHCFHSLNPTQAGLFVAFAEDAVRQFYHAVKRGGEMEENYKLLVRLFRKGIFRCQTYTPISKASTKQVLESIKDVGCMAWVKWKEGAKTGRLTEIATAQRKIERKEEETRKQAKPAKIVAALTDRTEEQRTEIKTKIKTLYRTMGEAHKKAGDVCDMLADLVDEVPEEVFVTIAENTTRPLIHLKVPVMDELCKRQEEAEVSKGIQWTKKPISEVVLYQNLPTPNKRWPEKDYLKPTACLAGAIYWYMHRICEPNEIQAQDRVGKIFGVPKATFHRVVSGKRYRGGADPKPGLEGQKKHQGAGKKSKRTAVEEEEVQPKKAKTSETSGVSGKSSKKQKHGKISKEGGKKALMPKRTDRMTEAEKGEEEDVTEMENRRTVVTSINKQPPRRATRAVTKAKSPRGRTEEDEEMDLEEELDIADFTEQEKKEYWRLKKVASEVQE